MRRETSCDLQSKPKLIFSQKAKTIHLNIFEGNIRMRQFITAQRSLLGFECWLHCLYNHMFSFQTSLLRIIKSRSLSRAQISVWFVALPTVQDTALVSLSSTPFFTGTHMKWNVFRVIGKLDELISASWFYTDSITNSQHKSGGLVLIQSFVITSPFQLFCLIMNTDHKSAFKQFVSFYMDFPMDFLLWTYVKNNRWIKMKHM